MQLKINNNERIEFEIISLTIKSRNISSVFYGKNNKTLAETFESKKYLPLKSLIIDKYSNWQTVPLGNFLKFLKEEANDCVYLKFLNKYGDERFCEYEIQSHLNDKGIYCYVIDDEIKYIGRCTDNFKKRVNQGYGKIHPKNCFIDGQATNCHINSLVNANESTVKFGVYTMSNKSTEEIEQLEKEILKSSKFAWNIQQS